MKADTVHGFVGSVLSSRFDGKSDTPDFHRECWELFCSDHQYCAVAAPRGHAKSTALTLGYGLSTLLFRERKFMLLVSDTETQAALFLGTFQQELQDNKELVSLFGLKLDEKGLVKFVKESATDIIVEFNDGHQFRIIAKGAEQKLRGLLWDGSRPDIICIDDFENDELVMNPERRTKMRRWFNGALVPCISDNGIIRMVGTILHNDSLLERLMPNPSEKTTHRDGLKTYSTKESMWKTLKYRAHNEDFSELLWPTKKKKSFFKRLYEEAVREGMSDVYSQEYLNIPIDEASAFFKRNDFLAMKQEHRDKELQIYITGDLAISETQKADYSVFLIAGVDQDRNIYILDCIRDRLDGKEIVDTILALQNKYDPAAFGIEDMQVTKAIGPFLREEMMRTNIYPSIYPLKHGGKDKTTRARPIQARMRAHTVRFEKDSDWYPDFENELLTFPRGKHDDQVDCFAYLGYLLDKLIEAPTQEEMEEEEYADEYESSQLSQIGRNATTGY